MLRRFVQTMQHGCGEHLVRLRIGYRSHSQRGEVVQWAVLVALLVAVVVAGIAILRPAITTAFTNIASQLTGANT